MLRFNSSPVYFRLLQSSSSVRLLLKARVIVALVCAIAVTTAPAQRKKKEEETQTLQIPRELPGAVSGDPRRMSFHVTPLSNKGLLSQQIRDALKAAARDTGADTVLKIRAFVAGSGDLRRVRDLVSEVFTDRRQPLPALSLVQSGGLPMEGAQVVLEVTAAGRKEVNPNGLAYISAQVATSEDPAGSGGSAGGKIARFPEAGCQGGRSGAFGCPESELFPEFSGEPGRHAQTGGCRVSQGGSQLLADAARSRAGHSRVRSGRAAPFQAGSFAPVPYPGRTAGGCRASRRSPWWPHRR